MVRPFVLAVVGLVAGAGSAFEVQGTVKRVDPDTGAVVAITGQDRTVRVPKDVKVLDADGKPLADGFKAKEMKECAAVTLTVERENNKPVIRALRLTGKAAAAPPAPPSPSPAGTSAAPRGCTSPTERRRSPSIRTTADSSSSKPTSVARRWLEDSTR